MIRLRFLPVLFLMLGLAACQSPEAVGEKQLNAEQGWPIADSLLLQYEAHDTLPRQLVLKLEVTEDYPFNNLWVRYTVKDPAGKVQQGRAEFLLATSDGKWLGTKNPLTGTVSATAVLNEEARFRSPGTYQFSLVQYMRADTLKGVQLVQFSILPAAK